MPMIFINGQSHIHSINFNKMMITEQFISLSKEVCHARHCTHGYFASLYQDLY